MKVDDFAYNVATRTMELLEETQHYKIPAETRKEIAAKVLAELTALLRRSS